MAATAESSLVASSESPFNVKSCVKLFHLMVACVQHLSSLFRRFTTKPFPVQLFHFLVLARVSCSEWIVKFIQCIYKFFWRLPVTRSYLPTAIQATWWTSHYFHKMIRGFATLYFLHEILESPKTTQLAKANSNYIIYILPCFYILFHFNFILLHFKLRTIILFLN